MNVGRPLQDSTFTVAVCTYRRFEQLGRCLEALAQQSDAGFKLLVVDNSCMPAESERCRERYGGSPNLEYVITQRSGLSFARNVALQSCSTPFIAYLDDDAVPDVDWAENLGRALTQADEWLGVLGGPVRPSWESTPPSWLRGKLLGALAVIDWGDEELVLEQDEEHWLVGANIAYRTSALLETGGFDESLGRAAGVPLCHEELAATRAIRRLGYSVAYDPGVVVSHLIQQERMTPEWMIRDGFWEAVSRRVYTGELSAEALLNQRSQLIELVEQHVSAERSWQPSYRRVVAAREEAAKLARSATARRAASPQVDGIAVPARLEFAVVVPVLNAGSALAGTLDSVLSQQGDFDIRLHVQDGGSEDDTLTLLEALQRQLRDNADRQGRNVHLTFASEPDAGLYDALQKGALALDGAEVSPMTWINAGDFFLPGAFAAMSRVFSELPEVSWVVPPVLVYRDGVPISFAGVQYPKAVVSAGLCDGIYWPTIQQEGVFWRRRLWARAGDALEAMRLAGDWALWRSFAEEAIPYHVDWPVAAFTISDGQLSSRSNRYQAEIAKHRSREQTQQSVDELSMRPDLLSVAAISPDFRIDWKPLALDGSTDATLARAIADRRGDLGGSLESASSVQLIEELTRRDPGFAARWGAQGSPQSDRSRLFYWLQSHYRRLPGDLRLSLRPMVRKLFGR